MKTKLFILFIAILAFGCEKSTNGHGEITKKSASNPWAAAANPANPYESAGMGVHHNRAVEFFRTQRPNYPSTQAWIDAAAEMTLEFSCGGSDSTFCASGLTDDHLIALNKIASNDSLFNEKLSSLPAIVINLADSILNHYEMYNSNQYVQFHASLVNLEQHIVSLNLPEKNAEMLLMASQVARYSGLYWKQQIDNDFAAWELPNEEDISWSSTSGLDVRGALTGYMDGHSAGIAVQTGENEGIFASIMIAATNSTN